MNKELPVLQNCPALRRNPNNVPPIFCRAQNLGLIGQEVRLDGDPDNPLRKGCPVKSGTNDACRVTNPIAIPKSFTEEHALKTQKNSPGYHSL